MINQRKSLEEWEDFFKDAYSADFFASSGATLSNIRVQRAQFYGRQKPAFLYLGPKYCPTSYFSAKLFWLLSTKHHGLLCINLIGYIFNKTTYFHLYDLPKYLALVPRCYIVTFFNFSLKKISYLFALWAKYFFLKKNEVSLHYVQNTKLILKKCIQLLHNFVLFNKIEKSLFSFLFIYQF